MDITFYPCGQKLMIWKTANKTKAIFHSAAAAALCVLSYCVVCTEDAFMSIFVCLSTGNT